VECTRYVRVPISLWLLLSIGRRHRGKLDTQHRFSFGSLPAKPRALPFGTLITPPSRRTKSRQPRPCLLNENHAVKCSVSDVCPQRVLGKPRSHKAVAGRSSVPPSSFRLAWFSTARSSTNFWKISTGPFIEVCFHSVLRLTSGPSFCISSNSSPMVGTVVGSKSSTFEMSIGVQTRPVFGWMANGALSK
jgi:hypothetical protein